MCFVFFFFLIRKSNFGSPKIGIPKLPLVWYPYIYISSKKLPSALRKSFKKFVPINRIICTVYSTLSYSSALLCKTKREKNREAIKEEFWERERERHTSWSRSVAGVEWLGGAAAVLDGWWFLRLVWGFFFFFLKPMHLGLGFRILRFPVWWGIGEAAEFFFFFSWANSTIASVTSSLHYRWNCVVLGLIWFKNTSTKWHDI